uniref:Uncharacterized protein n=1 Tax=Rhizophora mucronata TaxID=61149 RepID=A0A2P2PF45_RHIMU
MKAQGSDTDRIEMPLNGAIAFQCLICRGKVVES